LVFWLFAGNFINQRVSYSAPTPARPPVLSSAELKRITKETIVVPNIGHFQLGTLTVSPDGRRFAYARKESKGWVVEVDGKIEGTFKAVGIVHGPVAIYAQVGWLDLVGVKPMIFSADSRHLAYSAREDDSWFMVKDGEKSQPFKSVGSPILSRDGKRLAFAAQVPGGWCMVLDGKPGKPFEKLGPPAFSPDGRRFAYAARSDGKERMVVDGVEGKVYESLDVVSGLGAWLAFPNMVAEFPVFSADGRLAHHGKLAGKWYNVVEGQDGEAFDKVSDIVFSPDGKRIAFGARKPRWTVVVDGKDQGVFDETPYVNFSPDSKRIVMVGETGGKQTISVDGKQLGTHQGIGVPTFSPDSSRVAYAFRTGKQWSAVIDGATQKAYLSVDPPVFSPDGKHVAYVAAVAKERWTVVVDGVEGKIYDGILKGSKIVFADDTHFHYFVVSGKGIVFVEEELQTP
jgi:dipeptidyl aminopeptidase/acylaminoacyl peptidase